MPGAGLVEVGKLRVRGATDTPRLRRETMSAVRGAEIHPPDLAPAAILVVRHLRDAAPGRFRPGGSRTDEQWERATRRAISRLARNAYRVARGHVPPNAEAVLFSNRAELIACLLVDMARGVAGRRWWWNRILGRLAPSGGLAELMAREAAVLPAAMHTLAANDLAAEVVAPLSSSEIVQILGALAAAHRVEGLDSCITSASVNLDPASPSASLRVAHPANPAATTQSAVAPWDRLVSRPAGVGSLPGELQLLVGVTQALHVRAAEVRRKRFRGAATEWLSRQSWAAGELPPETRFPNVAGSREAAVRDAAAISPDTAAVGLHSGDPAGAPASQVSDDSRRGVSVAMAVEAEPGSPPPVPEAPRPTDSGMPAPIGRLFDEPAGLPSSLSGVMFLVNLVDRLDLPGCFEVGWRLGSLVGRWGLVEAIGRSLLARSTTDLDDPIWSVLGQLAGRVSGNPPGADVISSDSYELPLPWWSALTKTEDRLFWGSRGGELRAWTSSGFIVTQSRRGGGAAEAAHALAPYSGLIPRRRAFNASPVAGLPASDTVGIGSGLWHWMELAMPAIERWLTLALRVPTVEIAEVLLQREGRVFATNTHVDVIFPLDAASVAVRRCGLDRDPGWVPELGRVVAFHFE